MRVFEESTITARGNILSYDDFLPFSDVASSKLSDEIRESLINNARQALHTPFEMLSPIDYLRFYRDGNRSVYEKIFFDRRNAVFTLLFGEYAENKGHFSDKLAEGVWHILEETTWIVPAHMKTLNKENYGLCDEYEGKVENLDLFSASTGALLAVVYYFGKAALDSVTPVISKRIIYELRKRIFTPFSKNPDLWWKGEKRFPVNNWNPWIISNVLTAAAFCVTDLTEREEIAEKAMRYLDNFTAGYAPDGGCDEGPNYWSVAGGSLFDCFEILYDMSAGKVDVFSVPLVKKIFEYIMNAHISGNHFLPFADTHLSLSASYPMIARCGKRIGSRELYAFGCMGCKNTDLSVLGGSCPYRSIKQLFFIKDETQAYKPRKSIFFNDLCVFAFREHEIEGKGLYLAGKGGHNNESHNHNDVGNFVVYSDAEPLIIDVGVGTYSKETFSENRYKIWTMQSSYHNLPEINGISQKEGRQFCATNTFYDEEKQTIRFELTRAYPRQSMLKSFVRTASLSGKTVFVCDEILLEGKGKISFCLMTCDKPQITDASSLSLCLGRTLSFPPVLLPEIEEIPLLDDGLRRDWKRDKLFRIILTEENTPGGKYVFVIK
ncbi:MAG: Heparinase II/III-like protein [Firmicutes bacterium ADurb.Bin300]|nr:MAG: Heparinase II/III-like protein [Firmicutes bacterium ADurb.Bin300]